MPAYWGAHGAQMEGRADCWPALEACGWVAAGGCGPAPPPASSKGCSCHGLVALDAALVLTSAAGSTLRTTAWYIVPSTAASLIMLLLLPPWLLPPPTSGDTTMDVTPDGQIVYIGVWVGAV